MKRFALLLITIASFMTLMASEPDFAYPETTLENAVSHYEAAISSPETTNSGLTVIKSLLETIGATSAIDPDSLVRVIPNIDRAIGVYNGPDKALIQTIKAELLSAIYGANRWTYDRVETPDEPIPADVTEWNGRQFTLQVQTLLRDAFDLAASQSDWRLSSYQSIIRGDRTTYIYFPTVASFIASKAISNSLGDGDEQFRNYFIDKMVAMSPKKSSPWFYWKVTQCNAMPATSEQDNPLDKLYLDNSDCEESGYALSQIASRYYHYDDAPEWLIPSLKTFIDSYPAFWQNNTLKNALNRLTASKIKIGIDRIVSPKETVKINVGQYFVKDYSISIYKLTKEEYDRGNVKLQSKTPYKTLTVNKQFSSVPTDTTLTFTLSSPGYYVAAASMSGASGSGNKAYFIASDYLPLLINGVDHNSFITANLISGAPVSGIAITETTSYNKNASSRALGKTDRDGILRFDPTVASKDKRWQTLEYSFSNGKNSISFRELTSFAIWESPSNKQDKYHAQLFIDREIYHPGDTVRWAAVITRSTNEGDQLTAADLNMRIEFDNANRQTVDTATVRTDALGRVTGCFIAPETGLTGNFQLKIRVDEPTVNWLMSRRVTISDFKLPTFKITDLSVSRDAPVKGNVTLSGRAVSYAGMAISQAKVEAEIWQASRWRWFSPSRRLGVLEATTDAGGAYEIIVPDSLLSNAEGKCFVAKISVTSPAGEAQHISQSFTTGKPYYISYEGSTDINSDSPLKDAVAVYDADGKTVDIDLRWWITCKPDSPETDALASGTCNSSTEASIDLQGVRSGVYYLSVAPVDPSLADPSKNTKIRLYSLKNNTLPNDAPYLLINQDIEADADGNATFTLGSSGDKSYFYISGAADNRLYDLRTIVLNRGFHKISTRLPEGARSATLWLIAVRNGKVTRSRINISRPDTRRMTIEGEAMRDFLTPGAEERWTLRLTDSDNLPVGEGAGLIATMFNAALNSLATYNMPSRLYYNRLSSSINVIFPYNGIESATAVLPVRTLGQDVLTIPEFFVPISYHRVYLTSGIRVRGTGKQAAMIGSAEVEDAVVMNYAAAKSMATADSVEAEEAELEDEAAEDAGENDGVPSQEIAYRDAEVLQAFWLPELTFDNNGVATLSFTVPNANTTWAFDAFAWTRDARSAKMAREFIASKPVMTEPNLPRFLRQGDIADVIATVYNNTDSDATVTTVVEIFDISTGDVITQSTFTDLIAARASTTVSCRVAAAGDITAVGYRVRSTLGRFTDGVRSFIPVIPSTSDVIESNAFYLNPGEDNVQLKVPSGKKMTSTLEYTANPAWNIIKELPSLAQSEAMTSIGASRQLFGAATSDGLLTSNPVLGEVIRSWSTDPDSKALISRLSQNDELKAVVLNSTPWVQAAAGDTERMSRLALLLDRKANRKAIASSIATLKKLVRADGGWSWGQWCNRSSLWMTYAVLRNLAQLNAAGYLPDDTDLHHMISGAISYCESQFASDEKINYEFTYIHALLPRTEISLKGQQMVNATVRHIVANWKKSSTARKAVETVILDALDNKAVAREIISSLDQFAVPSKDKGTSFPSVRNINDYADLLFAYARIAPESKIIDGMRQWLVMRQQTTTELASADPTRIIAAFATCGSDWFDAKQGKTDIAVGGAPIAIGETEIATGHFVTNLSAADAGKLLTITRTGSDKTPAYGALISRYVTESNSVKAQSCSDLSVEKRITALRGGRWQYVDEVALGEQVKVLITIKVKRDLQYVTVVDERPAAFEPVDQLPGLVWSGGAAFYRENRDSSTNLFIDYLPKGTYQITLDMTASTAGEFTSGIATVQSQLAPSVTAHSAGSTINCKR